MGTADPPAAVVSASGGAPEEGCDRLRSWGGRGAGRPRDEASRHLTTRSRAARRRAAHLQELTRTTAGHMHLYARGGDRQRAQELYERAYPQPTCRPAWTACLFLQSCKRPSHVEASQALQHPDSAPSWSANSPPALRARTAPRPSRRPSHKRGRRRWGCRPPTPCGPHDPLTEQLYGRAVKAGPAAVNALSNYGLYLSEMKRDCESQI